MMDDTDDSRFTVEKMEVMLDCRDHVDKRLIVLGVMDAVCGSLDERLERLEDIIEKNKRDVRKCQHRVERYREIIENYGEVKQSEDLTSVIKYYFALAKSDKYPKAKEELSVEKRSLSPLDYERTFHTTRSKEERQQLEEDIQWLANYGTVNLTDSRVPT